MFSLKSLVNSIDLSNVHLGEIGKKMNLYLQLDCSPNGTQFSTSLLKDC